MSGTKMTINKRGGCDAIYTADGTEIEGVLCNRVQLTQEPHHAVLGMVLVKMEMLVYEKDLSATGKFKATDFIVKTPSRRIRSKA